MAGDFSLLQNVQTRSGARPVFFNRYRRSLLGVKRPYLEVERSLPSSATVKNKWISTFTPPARPHDMDRDNFVFMFKTSLHDNIRALWLRRLQLVA